jgi:hypothetical protein
MHVGLRLQTVHPNRAIPFYVSQPDKQKRNYMGQEGPWTPQTPKFSQK